MHAEKDIRDWFEKEYKPALEFTEIKHRKYIYNIDEKGCRIACPSEEEVIVPIRIKEMHVEVSAFRDSYKEHFCGQQSYPLLSDCA